MCDDNHNKIDSLYKCLRFVDILNNTEQDNQDRFKFKVDHALNCQDYNVSLYNDKSRLHFQKLIQGQRVMRVILGIFDKNIWLAGEMCIMTTKNIAENINAHFMMETTPSLKKWNTI
jgi:hypothetical protein